MVCSQPPEGQARWTVRLIAEEAVKRKLVPRVGRETIRVLLTSHDLKPWREKNVVYHRSGHPGPPHDGRHSGRLLEALSCPRAHGLIWSKTCPSPYALPCA